MRISAIDAVSYSAQTNRNQSVNQPAQVSVAQQPSFGAPQKVATKKSLWQSIRDLLGISNKKFADELDRQVSSGRMTNQQAEELAKMKMSNYSKKK